MSPVCKRRQLIIVEQLDLEDSRNRCLKQDLAVCSVDPDSLVVSLELAIENRSTRSSDEGCLDEGSDRLRIDLDLAVLGERRTKRIH